MLGMALGAGAIRSLRAEFFLSRGSQGRPGVDAFAGGSELLRGTWVQTERVMS